MARCIFENLTPEQVKTMAEWFDGQGEQDAYAWFNAQGVKCPMTDKIEVVKDNGDIVVKCKTPATNPKSQNKTIHKTLHISLSVYGPNTAGKFRGAISIDGDIRHGEYYDDFETANRCSIQTLAEIVESGSP